MTRRELNLAIFEGTTDKVLWQPRLDTWISAHWNDGTMPERFSGMTKMEIYDELRCSPRYAGWCGYGGYTSEDAEIEHSSEEQGSRTINRIKTPVGELTTVHRRAYEDGESVNQRIEKYPVTTPEDLRVVTYLVNQEQFRSEPESYYEGLKHLGDREETTGFLSTSGFTDLIKSWAGLVDTHYLLHDHPAAVEEYLEACDRRDDRLVDAALGSPCRIFNFGDHATNEFTPPPILKKYLLPRWQRLSARLHEAGRFCHSHWDGNSRHMLPYLLDSGLDAVEALTPEPMGDMTLEMIKDAVKDKMIVLDLIPVIDFLPNASTAHLLDFTKRIIDMFAPRLILGISDELSPPGQIEKVEAVTNLVDKICGLPT